jgi:hypothetical protein
LHAAKARDHAEKRFKALEACESFQILLKIQQFNCLCGGGEKDPGSFQSTTPTQLQDEEKNSENQNQRSILSLITAETWYCIFSRAR